MGERRFTIIPVIEFIGQQGRHPCGCPQRLSNKTCGFLHAEGRDGEWDKRLGLGNPAADKSVKNYLRLVSAEQLQSRVTPKQATPFFVDKLTMLSLHLQRELEKSTSAIQRFIIARYQASFKTGFLLWRSSRRFGPGQGS